MKAWWDDELTTIRQHYTRLRNWDNQLRRWGEDRTNSRVEAARARNQLHNTIRDKKRSHWNEFLGQADNIWKAAKYLDPQPSAFGNIPVLVTQQGSNTVEVESDGEKAQVLLNTFFPPVPDGWKEDEIPEPRPIEMHDPEITTEEIEGALSRITPWKAPGIDGIPNIV
jgi:hypothetical protein